MRWLARLFVIALLIAAVAVLVFKVFGGSAGRSPGADGSSAAAGEPGSTRDAGSAARPNSDDSAWTPQKPEFLALAERITTGKNAIMGRGAVDDLRGALAKGGMDAVRTAQTQSALIMEELRLGEIDQAIETATRAIAAAEASPAAAATVPNLFRRRALAYLRKAELENCLRRHNRDCCIFPLKDGGVHEVSEPARLAKADYLHYLAMVPAEIMPGLPSEDHLVARWLLNIACMALEEYPDGVPAEYLIPPAALVSEYDMHRFVDVAPKLGLDTMNYAGGVIVDDFDGDGLYDIVTSNCHVAGPMKAFRNVGDGTFEDVSAAWRLDDQFGGLHITSVDYNNDGLLDILVPRGAWMLDDGRMRRSLLRHNSDGTFTDVTLAAGLAEPFAPHQAVVWADFNNDGWLDLYVGNESRAGMEGEWQSYPSQLFRNNRDGTFTDVAVQAGVINDRYAKGVAAGDYDNDGDMDLYVSNLGHNRLYRNNGDMTFTDVAPQLGMIHPANRSFATWFFDYDNDGDLDLWVGSYQARLADVVKSCLEPHSATQVNQPCLYRNNGDGAFTNVARELNLDRAWLPMGANFGDFDNDGWLDIYLGTGDPAYETLVPNVALRNDGGRRFQDVTQAAGLGHLQKGHGIGFADIDHDGDQDIYHELGGFYPGDNFRNALFLNPGDNRRHVGIELVGVKTNRMAIGARLAVHVTTPAGQRTLHRAVGSISSFGGSPRRQEIGLADATSIGKVEVWWPTSNTRQIFTNVPLDSVIRITEGQDGFETLDLKPFQLKIED